MSKHEVHTRGVIISRFSAGEGSVRAALFTEHLGLVTGFAKSAREERSKLRPHLVVGTIGHFDLVRGRDIWRVTGATATRNAYFAHTTCREVQQVAVRYIALLRTLIQGEDRDEEVFRAVWDFLTALHTVPEAMLVHAERFAVLTLLAHLGYVSREAVPGTVAFDYSVTSLEKLVPLEKSIAEAMKQGFVASGLL